AHPPVRGRRRAEAGRLDPEPEPGADAVQRLAGRGVGRRRPRPFLPPDGGGGESARHGRPALERRPGGGAAPARGRRGASPRALRAGAGLRRMNRVFFFTRNLYIQISIFRPRARSNDMDLPSPGMTIDRRTALVLTDLQNDFLSPGGIAWGLVADSLAENNTVENLESLLRASRRHGLPVFISPHYYYPTD